MLLCDDLRDRVSLLCVLSRSPEDFESPLCLIAREADGSFPVEEVEVDLAEEPGLWVADVIRPVD